MAYGRYCRIAILIFLLASIGTAQPNANKRVLAIGAVKGFQHDATTNGLATIWKLGRESGFWDTYIRTDTQLLTKKKLEANAKNLDYFDAVLFYTTGELDMDDQQADLLKFVREDGKGFLAVHSGIDTLYGWPEYGEMVGGYFDGHPWNQFQAPIIVEDRNHPITREFPSTFTIVDEIYPWRSPQIRPYVVTSKPANGDTQGQILFSRLAHIRATVFLLGIPALVD
jgi:type 1 glutamine amidotransferase